jgi:hypothetical protein
MRRWIATGLLVALLATALPTLALAGSGGRRNTALGLSGLAAYELLNGHTTVGALSAAGAAYSWLQYSKARKNEKRQARLTEYYRSRYYNSGPGSYSSYRRTSYYSSGPYTRVRSYRSSYNRGRSVSARHRRSSTYLAGYRAGYRRGVRVCRTQHGYA